MQRMVRCLALLAPFVSTHSFAETAASVSQWQINATCAAGYQANWQNRMSMRAPSMSDGIRLQAEDYAAAAVRQYQKEENASLDDAKQKVASTIAAHVERFVAMDKAGTLEPFLDSCPQIEEVPPN
jgi:hypothetical protein